MKKKYLYEELAAQYLDLTAERYPTPEKIIKIAVRMGFREPAGQIVILSQFRDAIRGCSPKLFRSDQQKLDLWNAIVEALEVLEDEVEEELEEYEEEEEEEEEGVT